MNKLPRARTANLVVQNLNNEGLVYDLTTNQAYCLNETSAKVFNACDGKASFDDLKHRYKFTDDLIHFAIDELKANNLIVGQTTNYFGNLSRREVIKRVGLASMVALPVIAGITAPTAAHAASGSVNCLPPNQCFAAGTVACPPGCTATILFIAYASTNGTCAGIVPQGPIDCAANQGTPTIWDFRRT